MDSRQENTVVQRPASRGRSRRAALIVALLSGALFALLAPNEARANYTVKECANGIQPGAFDPYLISAGTYRISYSNECTAGSGYGLRLDARGTTSPGGRLVWQVSAPSGTAFKTADMDVHYGTDDGYGPAMAAATGGYAPLNGGSGPNQWAHASLANTDHFGIWLMCWRTGQSCSSSWAYAWSANLSAEVVDMVPPQIAATGELLDGTTVRGVQSLQATATDVGGGVRSIAVYVNRVSSRVDPICGPQFAGSYERVKPCLDSSGPRTFSVDTQNDPGWVNGPNDVSICSTDAGGNQSPCIHRLVDVDNSCPSSGSQPAARFEAGTDVAGRLRTQASVRSNEAPVLRGALATATGAPVAGGTVCVYQTIALADASRELVTTLTTQPNGRFATKLDPGASRIIELIYRYNTHTLGQRVGLDSVVVPSLSIGEKSVANGHPVHFRGHVPGPNADGRAVALQARVGRKWRTFKQLRTDEGGRFKGLYRFTQTVGRVSYVFRALVKRQSGYPYEAGASRKRKILVYG
jgi:5-hydroxyisourate hydrolase-like protein (transthyretin family)